MTILKSELVDRIPLMAGDRLIVSHRGPATNWEDKKVMSYDITKPMTVRRIAIV